MKRFLFFTFTIILFLLPAILKAQISIEFDINADTVEIDRYVYKRTNKKIKQVFLRVNFGSYKIVNPSNIKKIKGKVVNSVELYYSDYPENFDMDILNKKRLISLFLISHNLFYNSSIEWKIVKQTAANAKNVYSMFHGFIITYNQQATTWQFAQNKKDYFHDIIKGERIVTDSTVLKVFDRNQDWDNMLIVTDFTGSMSPYVAQVLLWYHLNFNKKRNQAFVFFNDGNNKPVEEKIIGETGGMYHTDVNNIDSVVNTAVYTISSGGGGDKEENDVEAIIFGIKKYPTKKNIILIADNTADMRDYSLIEKVNRPVKIILCGAGKKVNTQYLDLARKTKGSIHTIEEDITDLMKLKEGQTIKIEGTVFKIENGKFVEVSGI